MFKKLLVNCFLIVWLLVLAIDSAPETGNWHRELKSNLDFYLDITGLWQGGWQLFAPDPDKMNVSITATATFEDGREVVWRSPDWRSLSTWQRFLSFREAEFIDDIRLDHNAGAWPDFADYLSRTVRHPGDPDLKPTMIVLKRNWVVIPRPNPINISQFPEVPAMNRDFIFFAEEYQP
jgi:hypothetical protein